MRTQEAPTVRRLYSQATWRSIGTNNNIYHGYDCSCKILVVKHKIETKPSFDQSLMNCHHFILCGGLLEGKTLPLGSKTVVGLGKEKYPPQEISNIINLYQSVFFKQLLFYWISQYLCWGTGDGGQKGGVLKFYKTFLGSCSVLLKELFKNVIPIK